jgi:hypothetical protein
MVVPTFPVFEYAFNSLYRKDKDNIEEARSKLVKVGDDVLGYPAPDEKSQSYYWLLELNGLIDELHHFEIEDDLKTLLLLTRAPKKPEVLLPFESIYLDVTLKKSELEQLGIHLDVDEISGIVVRKGDIIHWNTLIKDDHPIVIGKDLRLSVLSKNYLDENQYINIQTFPSQIEVIKGYTKSQVDKDLRTYLSNNDKKVVADFVINLLYFINNPEVRYTECVRSAKKQQRRLKAGKPVLPSSYRITLTGTMLKYLNEVKSGQRSECWYCFEVRGHKRTLRSEFYKEKRGVTIWVEHFEKGKDKGILIQKHYDADVPKDLNPE